MAISEHKKTWLLDKLVNYKNIGETELSQRTESFRDGEAVWKGEFRESPPDDSMYYAVVFGLLRHYVRAARKMYMGATDIVSVTPEGSMATSEEADVAKLMTEEMNYHLQRWVDILPFVDDTMTQALKTGVCFGKVYWERETMQEEYEDTTPQFEFVDGELIESEAKTFIKEFITKNKLRIEYVPIGKLVWDPTAWEWDRVKWAIQIDIEKTEDELLALVDTDGYSKKAVNEFLYANKKESYSETPDEVNIYKIAEFWGEMLVNEGDRRTKFVKCVMSNDGEYLLKEPDENVYKTIDGEPMIPFQAGYLIRDEGEIIGESLCVRGKEYQGEINCIRNQRRRSVENDLNERYLAEKSAEVEFSRFENQDFGSIIYTSDMDGFREMRHSDNTSTSYGELAAVDKNLIELLGVTPTILGMTEQGMTDTLGGLQLMSNASQVIIFDALLSYNNTFFEKILTKAMHMSLQYMSIEELQADGMNVDEFMRGQMKKRFRLRIDAGMGATSENVKLNNLKTAYFVTQQFIQYCDQSGLEPGDARLQVIDLLKQMLPLLNVKDPKYIPSPEEIAAQTEQMVEGMRQQEQIQQQQQGQAAQQEIEGFRADAARAGQEAVAKGEQAQLEQNLRAKERGAAL